MFFKTHLDQPFNNVIFNSLISYYRVKDIDSYKREWLIYEHSNKLFYCTFCLASQKILTVILLVVSQTLDIYIGVFMNTKNQLIIINIQIHIY